MCCFCSYVFFCATTLPGVVRFTPYAPFFVYYGFRLVVASPSTIPYTHGCVFLSPSTYEIMKVTILSD